MALPRSLARPTDDTAVRDAARALAARAAAGTARPTPLGAWREVARTGRLAGDEDPDATAAGLVRRWHQHLAVAIDLPMERHAPGAERLPALLSAWLDLARRTPPVRAHVAAVGGPRTAAEQARQARLLTGLLAQDLAELGAREPVASAAALLAGLAQVAAAEDLAGRPLPTERRRLTSGVAAPPAASARERRRARPRRAAPGWCRVPAAARD